MSESQSGSRGRFSSENDQQVAYTILIQIIQSMEKNYITARELFQEKLFDYESLSVQSKGTEYILVDDFFNIVQNYLEITVGKNEKDRFKKVFAEIY